MQRKAGSATRQLKKPLIPQEAEKKQNPALKRTKPPTHLKHSPDSFLMWPSFLFFLKEGIKNRLMPQKDLTYLIGSIQIKEKLFIYARQCSRVN